MTKQGIRLRKGKVVVIKEGVIKSRVRIELLIPEMAQKWGRVHNCIRRTVWAEEGMISGEGSVGPTITTNLPEDL